MGNLFFLKVNFEFFFFLFFQMASDAYMCSSDAYMVYTKVAGFNILYNYIFDNIFI